MRPEQPLQHAFPKASQYDPEWVRRHSMGENVLFNLESLTKSLELKPGMRVLDLGCGKAISSIFLAKEFGVTVWAVDEAIAASDNYQRILDAGCEENVIPLEADARALPFAEEYFDAVIVVDSYTYFGTISPASSSLKAASPLWMCVLSRRLSRWSRCRTFCARTTRSTGTLSIPLAGGGNCGRKRGWCI